MRTLALLVLLLAVRAGAQTGVPEAVVAPLVMGTTHTFRSAALGQDRTLNVILPDGYADSLHYPVVYVLDGSVNEDLPHLAGLVQFLSMYELAPKSIVVGIANVDRYHDFTHPTRSDSDRVWLPTGGGSAAFIAFIAGEVLPYVDARFRTNGDRTIIGQSLGGLLVMELLFKRPELFGRYVAVSPSLWWDNGSLAKMAEEFSRAHGQASLQVYMALARDDDWMRAQMQEVRAAFTANTKAPFAWWYDDFPEETHATILHRAVYRAFERMRGAK